MVYKIEIEKFVKILKEKELSDKDIKEILNFIGIENNKIEKILSKFQENIEQQNISQLYQQDVQTKKKEKEINYEIVNLEKEIISTNFEIANLKNIFDGYKIKIDKIEKKVNEIEKKVNDLFSIIEENIPFLIKKE